MCFRASKAMQHLVMSITPFPLVYTVGLIKNVTGSGRAVETSDRCVDPLTTSLLHQKFINVRIGAPSDLLQAPSLDILSIYVLYRPNSSPPRKLHTIKVNKDTPGLKKHPGMKKDVSLEPRTTSQSVMLGFRSVRFLRPVVPQGEPCSADLSDSVSSFSCLEV